MTIRRGASFDLIHVLIASRPPSLALGHSVAYSNFSGHSLSVPSSLVIRRLRRRSLSSRAMYKTSPSLQWTSPNTNPPLAVATPQSRASQLLPTFGRRLRELPPPRHTPSR